MHGFLLNVNSGVGPNTPVVELKVKAVTIPDGPDLE